MSRNFILVFFVCSLLLVGCLPSPHYQKQVAIPQNAWQYQFQPSFTFDIDDTVSRYNMYFLIRHTEAYPFGNIWISIYTKQPGDTVFKKMRIEVPLAEPSGKWLGRGMSDIWEQRMPITSNNDTTILHKKGHYTIRFEQDMRVNPLPEVLQVGLRIEKR